MSSCCFFALLPSIVYFIFLNIQKQRKEKPQECHHNLDLISLVNTNSGMSRFILVPALDLELGLNLQEDQEFLFLKQQIYKLLSI